MSKLLCCDITSSSEEGPIYWWPLIFDAMSEHDLVYYDPQLSVRKGHFFYMNIKNTTDTNGITAPFRVLWDTIVTDMSIIHVSFWKTHGDIFNIDVSLFKDKHSDRLSLSLQIAGTEFKIRSGEESKALLQTFLSCSQSVYEFFPQGTGECYWQDSGGNFAPWATLGKPLDDVACKRPMFEGPRTQRAGRILADGRRMYWFDPAPIPIPKSEGNGWDGISLLSDAEKGQGFMSEMENTAE